MHMHTICMHRDKSLTGMLGDPYMVFPNLQVLFQGWLWCVVLHGRQLRQLSRRQPQLSCALDLQTPKRLPNALAGRLKRSFRVLNLKHLGISLIMERESRICLIATLLKCEYMH